MYPEKFRHGVLLTLVLCLTMIVPVYRAGGAGADVVHVSGNILVDTTWTSDHVYVVDADLTVTPSVTLTIQGGTVVKFARTANLNVQGGLQVNAPPLMLYLPVLFRGPAVGGAALASASSLTAPIFPEPGERVYLTSLQDDTVGGDTNGDGNATTPQKGDWGGIVFEDNSKDPLCSMRKFAMRYSGAPAEGEQTGAILLRNASPYLRDAEFLANYLDGIEIQRANWLNDVWDAAGIVYHVTGDLTVPRANTLFINQGMMIKFASHKRLTVMGRLYAVGSAGASVVFTSINDDTALGDTNGDGSATLPAVNDWGGIWFTEDTQANPGAVAYAEVRYSGRGILTNLAAIEISNSSPTFHHINFLQNNLNGVELTANRNELKTLALASTDVVYILRGDLQVIRNQTLTLGPGVRIKSSPGSSLRVLGVLNAVGSEAQPIIMTSLRDDATGGDTNNDGFATTPGRGDWGCVYFDPTSDDARNIMNHIALKFGGQDSTGFSGMIGAIRLNNSSPTLNNIAFSDNWINAVEIAEGTWSTDTWDNTDVVYFVSGNLTIPQGQKLTIVPGMVVKVADRISPTDAPEIRVQGALQVGASTGDPVVFTSGRDDEVGPANGTNRDSNGDGSETAPAVHDWVGITFTSTADAGNSALRNTRFSYGGTYSTSSQQPHAVLRFEGVNNVPVERCTFSQNYRGVEAMLSARPVITGTIFESNVSYAVYNDTPTTTTVEATHNWWDDASGPRSDGQPCNTATGYGALVSCGVNFQNWLTSRP